MLTGVAWARTAGRGRAFVSSITYANDVQVPPVRLCSPGKQSLGGNGKTFFFVFGLPELPLWTSIVEGISKIWKKMRRHLLKLLR